MSNQQEANRLYYEKNKGRLKENARERYHKNPDAAKERNRIWYRENRLAKAESTKLWRSNNRSVVNRLNQASLKRQIARSPGFKARKMWRTKAWRMFTKSVGGAKVISVLGCSAEQFRNHIYSQLHSGMTQENYAELWELDHIEPCYKFDCTKEDQLRACFHYTNYRPRLKTENQWHPNQKHETK